MPLVDSGRDRDKDHREVVREKDRIRDNSRGRGRDNNRDRFGDRYHSDRDSYHSHRDRQDDGDNRHSRKRSRSRSNSRSGGRRYRDRELYQDHDHHRGSTGDAYRRNDSRSTASKQHSDSVSGAQYRQDKNDYYATSSKGGNSLAQAQAILQSNNKYYNTTTATSHVQTGDNSSSGRMIDDKPIIVDELVDRDDSNYNGNRPDDDDIVLDESMFPDEEETEEERELRLLAESRRRREEIKRKLEAEKMAPAAPTSVVSQTNPSIAESTKIEDAHNESSDDEGDRGHQNAEKSEGNLDISKEHAAADAQQQVDVVTDNYAEEAHRLEEERLALEAEAKALRELGTFDMFSASPSGINKKEISAAAGQAMAAATGRQALREALLEGEDPHLASNWDDGEGYYKTRVGEIISDRYRTLGVIGKGVFSTVLKCQDLHAPSVEDDPKAQQHVAIKLIRNNDTMRKAAEKERSILLEITRKDPDHRKHCVQLLSHLDYRGHVAFVFEHQQMNLREALKKFGKDVGINIGAVRLYGKQLFVALKFLAELNVVHADIKLDNILCSGDLKSVKLCDFGSAFRMDDPDNNPTPYLVSRFYRAPEIILGLQYDFAIDIWSVCVSLYELFTGHVMMPGRTNNDMLRLMMSMKGKFPNKMIKQHFRSYETLQRESHFDPSDMRFRQYEIDPVTGKVIMKLVEFTQPAKDLSTVLRGHKAGGDNVRLVTNLGELLEKGLNLDPTKRLTAAEALKSAFFTLKL